jgi:rhodanese-related sulfurtransferase
VLWFSPWLLPCVSPTTAESDFEMPLPDGLARQRGFFRLGSLGGKLRSAAIVTILALAGLGWLGSPTWTQIDWFLAHRFADVETISTAELERALLHAQQNPQARQPVLLDIRSAEEFAVSRLPGARHVPPDTVVDFAERELAALDRSQPIVVYCAVGVRSAAAARDLRFLGFTQVKNLRGSLFQWANEGRTLEGGVIVHPYNGFWGKLLRANERL